MKVKININFKKMLLAVAFLVTGAVLQTQNTSAEEASWGPERPTYTWDHPADHVTFNSITNNPQIGDERNFVRVKEAGKDGPHLDNVTIEAGKEYEVYIYYHNNASASLNDSGVGISTLTQMSTTFPTKVSKGKAAVVKGSIFSKEGSPTTVYDTAYLNANDTLYLSYVANSAVIHNAGSADGSILDGESFLDESRGAKIGHFKEAWGMVPGCNEFAGYVTYRIRVDKPGFSIDKKVSADQENDFAERMSAKPGDTLDFKLVYKNIGTTDQLRVVAYDVMPEGMKYIVGTTFVKTPKNPEGVFVNDSLFNGGLVIGDFHPGETAEITYKVEIEDNKDLFPCGVSKKLYNNSSIATQNGTGYDKVEITITRECQQETCFNDDGSVKDTPECKCLNKDGSVKDTPECVEPPVEDCKNPDGTLKNTPECNSCFNEDGTLKDTYECKCYNEDGSVKDECKEPVMPSEMPETGPTEIVVALVMLSTVSIMVVYWLRSHMELKKLTKNL